MEEQDLTAVMAVRTSPRRKLRGPESVASGIRRAPAVGDGEPAPWSWEEGVNILAKCGRRRLGRHAICRRFEEPLAFPDLDQERLGAAISFTVSGSEQAPAGWNEALERNT
jgi:hypothetical protein